MIKIENITIAFDRPLIVQGVLEVHPGQLTLVQGESGCGKSSLLSVLGLLTNQHQEIYQFNNQIISDDDILRSEFRKRNIGFVFQDKSLFEHLNVYQNMQLYAEVSGQKLNKEKALDLLAQVHLKKVIDKDITTLSGGEKQRLAIACALCKNPELLILDEPTSALDLKNVEIILEILREQANQGKMIMIASHDPSLINACDVVYAIDEGKLKKVKTKKSKEIDCKISSQKKKIPFRFYLSYYRSFFQKNIANQLLMLIVCGLCVTVLMARDSVSKGYENKQLSHIDTLLGTEIFVTSQANNRGIAFYYQEMPTISEMTLKRIQNLKHLQAIYPYYEINVNSIGGVQTNCVIQPYTQNSPIAHYLLDGEIEKGGIYITASLANQMEQDVSFEYPVSIVGILPDGTTHVFNDVQVDGILDKDYHNDYSYADKIIFFPIDLMPKQDDIQALLVYSDHYDSVISLKEDIAQQDSSLGVFSAFSRTTEGNSVMTNIKDFLNVLAFVILLLSILLIGLIYSGYMMNRKSEISLLRVNGLSKKEISKLVLIEMILQTIMISCISLVLAYFGYQYFQRVADLSIQTRWYSDIFRSQLFAFLLMFFPNSISLFIYQKVDMATALRTD